MMWRRHGAGTVRRRGVLTWQEQSKYDCALYDLVANCLFIAMELEKYAENVT